MLLKLFIAFFNIYRYKKIKRCYSLISPNLIRNECKFSKSFPLQTDLLKILNLPLQLYNLCSAKTLVNKHLLFEYNPYMINVFCHILTLS